MRSFAVLFALCVVLCLTFFTQQAAANTKCTICQTLVEAIKDKAKDYDGKIDDAFKKKVCSKFGSFEPICDAYVDKYGPVIISALVDKVDPAVICKKLGFCKDDKWIRSLTTPEKAIDMYVAIVNKQARAEPMSSQLNGFTAFAKCEACEFAVEILQEYISQQKDKVVPILEKQCQRLPNSIRGFCLNIVDNYAPQLIDFLSKYPADEACAKIKFCPVKTAAESEYDEPPVVTVQASFSITIPKDTQCAMCQFAVNEVEKYIGSNKTEEAIKAGLHKVCAKLPGKYATECNQLVDTYAVVLIDMIIQQFPPEKACAAIGMCPAKAADATVAAPAPAADVAAVATSESNDTPCALCQLIVYAAEKYISQNTTEDNIKKALYKACGVMPGDYAKMCDAFVDQYLDQLIQLLKAKYPPKVICQKLGICPAQAKVMSAVAETPKPVKDSCFLCQMVITELYTKLNDSDTEKQVEQKLEQICALLPGQFGNQCKQYIEQYLPFIIQYVENNYPPKKICQLLGQCGPSQIPAAAAQPAALKKSGSNSYCAMCLNIVSQVELQLQDGATREQILKMLEGACTKLPSKWEHPCDIAVEYFGNKIIDLILQKEPPSVVCHQIGLCPKNGASAIKVNKQLVTLKTMARIN